MAILYETGQGVNRAPYSQWLFPSPQRGNQDDRAKTFRESLLLTHKAAGLAAFGFHDCRHHFISYAILVQSLDSRWTFSKRRLTHHWTYACLIAA